MTPRSISLVFALLAVSACSASKGEAPSSSSTEQVRASTCKEYVAPETTSTCSGCGASQSCQPNGCYGGYFCQTTTGKCKSAPPAGCSVNDDAGSDAGSADESDGGGDESLVIDTDSGANDSDADTDAGADSGNVTPAAPVIVSAFETPSSPGSAGLQPVIDAINGAQQSIQMAMYHLTVTAVADALVSAAQRGVTVQLIIDQTNWNSHTTASMKNALKNGGVQVTPSSTGFRITHEKSFVVDGATPNATAYIMSLNLTSPFVTTRDYAVATKDPGVVSEFLSVFNADLVNAQNGTSNTPPLSNPYLLWSPINSESRLVALVNSAQKTLVASSENLDSGPVAQAMASAAARGVDVRVIAPMCDENSNTAYDIPALTMLNNGGAQARAMPTPASATTPYVHAKMILVDGQQAYIGSVNLSVASMTDAREVGITFSDPTSIQMLSTAFEQDWTRASATFPAKPSCPALSAL